MSQRNYNAEGLVRFCAASAEMIPMFINGSREELEAAILKLYETAKQEFPNGPLALRDDLNRLASELDLPFVISAHHRDTGAIL